MSLINLYKINKTFDEIFNEINTSNVDNMIGGDSVSDKINKIKTKIDNIKNFSDEEKNKLKKILGFFNMFQGNVIKDNIYNSINKKIQEEDSILQENKSYLRLINKFPPNMIDKYKPLLKISFIYLNDYSNNINKEESHEEAGE